MTQGNDPERIVRSFLAAVEARDIEAAAAMLSPGCMMQFPGARPMTSLDAVVAWAAPRYRLVRKTIDGMDVVPGTQDGDATVYCRGTLSGEWPDGTSFEGIRFIDRFELSAGGISRQDVWNDIGETRNDQKAAR